MSLRMEIKINIFRTEFHSFNFPSERLCHTLWLELHNGELTQRTFNKSKVFFSPFLSLL